MIFNIDTCWHRICDILQFSVTLCRTFILINPMFLFWQDCLKIWDCLDPFILYFCFSLIWEVLIKLVGGVSTLSFLKFKSLIDFFFLIYFFLNVPIYFLFFTLIFADFISLPDDNRLMHFLFPSCRFHLHGRVLTWLRMLICTSAGCRGQRVSRTWRTCSVALVTSSTPACWWTRPQVMHTVMWSVITAKGPFPTMQLLTHLSHVQVCHGVWRSSASIRGPRPRTPSNTWTGTRLLAALNQSQSSLQQTQIRPETHRWCNRCTMASHGALGDPSITRLRDSGTPTAGIVQSDDC